MEKDKNTLFLDTDLEGEEFQNYVASKKVGDDVDFHVRGRIRSMDEGSIAVSVETVFKIEDWDNPDSGEEDKDEDDEFDGDEDGEAEIPERKKKPKSPSAMAVIFSETPKSKRTRSRDSVY